VRSGGCILVAGVDTKSNDGNGNVVFVVREGAERQEEGNGGAYWIGADTAERYIW